MTNYVIRRLLAAIPTFFGAVTIIFLIMRVLPGDVAYVILIGEGEGSLVDPVQLAALREQLGLNVSLWQQYVTWLSQLVHFDLGTSLMTGFGVWEEIWIRLPYSLTLIFLSILLSIILALPVGIFSALHRDSWPDYVLRGAAIAGIAAPNFWIALLVLIAVIKLFTWSPPIVYAPVYADPLTALQQLFLPALILGVRQTAVTARMLRSSMLEVLGEDYIRTARAKGLRERTVIYLHALRNALLPVLTIIGMEIIMVFGGVVILEIIFNIPGMGRLLIDGINNRDFPIVQGVTAVIIGVVLLTNLVVDLLYAWVDPRIKLR
jgi:peptide/nickel transport system permease protein